MNLDAFIAETLRRDGEDPRLAHMQDVVGGLTAGLQFLGYVGPKAAYPDPCHVRTLAYAVQPLTAMRWRVYDEVNYPPAAKVPALMRLWCERVPGWSPEYAYRAFMRVRPFGESTRWVALVVYQWLKQSWNDPVLSPEEKT